MNNKNNKKPNKIKRRFSKEDWYKLDFEKAKELLEILDEILNFEFIEEWEWDIYPERRNITPEEQLNEIIEGLSPKKFIDWYMYIRHNDYDLWCKLWRIIRGINNTNSLLWDKEKEHMKVDKDTYYK